MQAIIRQIAYIPRANKMLDTGDVVSKFHVDCVVA